MVSARSGSFSFLPQSLLLSWLYGVFAGHHPWGFPGSWLQWKATPNSAFAWPSLCASGTVRHRAVRNWARFLRARSSPLRTLHWAPGPPCSPAGSTDPRCTAEARSRWPRPAAIPRGAAIAASGPAEAALRAAAMSASSCERILTEPESVGRRRSAGTTEGAGCPAQMAVSEPGGSAAVSAMTGWGGLLVRGGLIGGLWLEGDCSLWD